MTFVSLSYGERSRSRAPARALARLEIGSMGRGRSVECEREWREVLGSLERARERASGRMLFV